MTKIHILHSGSPSSKEAYDEIMSRYPTTGLEEAEAVRSAANPILDEGIILRSHGHDEQFLQQEHQAPPARVTTWVDTSIVQESEK